MRRAVRTNSVIDPARSQQMARIKSRNTKPELRVRRFLHRAGLRFRLHNRSLPGKPDLSFASRRIVVFVHGCFWHRHPDPACKLTRTPKSRREFWDPKFRENVNRDERTRRALEELGWKVITFWECETQSNEKLSELADAIKLVNPSRRSKKRLDRRGTVGE